MDGGGGGSVKSTEEKGAEKLMDDYLKSLGLHRKKIAKDGSCLFRAVAEQVLHCQSLHTKVRAKCVEFLKENRESYEAFIEGDFEDYLVKLQDPQQWVGEVEINALAVMYKRDFLIFQEAGKPAVNITDNNFKDKVRLCFLNGNHYDSVYPVSHIKGAALCQSILYELLYDDVFQVDRSSLGPCQRGGRPADLLSDDSMNVCASSDDSDLDAGEPLWVENVTSTTTTRYNNQRGRGRGRLLPERVRRSLNPTLFRNVEYDVWHKSKRAQQKMDYCIAAGMQFTVGDRCQVRLEGRSYSATIKEVSPNNGPVSVYLEDLGTRKQVPLWSLRPHNDESSWSTVVNRDKRLNGEWEERGKGRGRGKNIAAASSSSVSQATAPGSSGRMLKQHSWPPQATVEEQGGSKVSRKSLSSTDPPFGLTEKQRSAKVEEQRTVALVEIQLRDENSFPALGGGVQSDGGRKKGGDKRRCQGTKAKSPVEDVGAPSPSAGERPKSSTPPLASTAAAPSTTPSTTHSTTPSTTTPPNPSLPAAKPPAAPSANADSNSAKSNTQCYALAPPLPPAAALAPPLPPAAALAPPLPPAAALAPPLPPAGPLSIKPRVAGGAVPPSVPFLPPALAAASCSSSPPLSLPPKSSSSPPPSLVLPPPTFIAPIAPSAAAAQAFLPPSSSLPRSSPPVSSLPHSPSPPSSSSSSRIHQAAQVHEAPPPSAQNPPNVGAPLTTSQAFQNLPLMPQNQSQISVTQIRTQTSTQAENQTAIPQMPQMQSEARQQHHRPQSLSEVVSLPQTPWSSLPQVQSCHPAPGSLYPPHTSQGSGPHLQPPHPSQVPHPSLSLSTSHPNTQNQTEDSPHPESMVYPPPHPSPRPQLQSAPPPPHPSPHPSPRPQLQSAPPPPHPSPHPSPHPPHLQSIPVAVPLSQLSQLYQDLLYPGFPQGETGDVAPTPLFSSSQSGDDLPQDLNILRFFFNLGIKAYSMPMCPPYLYLLPLQQTHTMQPKLPSRSPSPTLPHYPPTRHQEAYQPHPPYPPTSASMYDQQQAPVSEPPHPSDPHFTQVGYPFTQPQPPHRISSPSLSWQQQQMPPHRNTSYPIGYPNASSTYRGTPPPLSQGYHPGQGQGHLGYPQYSMGYQSSSAPPEELQVSQVSMEQRQPTNGDPMHGPSRVPGPLESPGAANVANANNRAVVVPGFGGASMSFPSALKKEQGDGMTRAVLLVDPPFNNTPIIKLVSKPDGKDVSMTTMNPRSSPSPYDVISKTTVSADNNNPSRGYRGYRRPPPHHHHHPTNAYVQLGPPEPNQVAYLESLSVGCSTEDDWDEVVGFKPTTLNHRGSRKTPRGGRGRGGYDPVRGGPRRRYGGDDLNYIQFSPSHRGRGRERGY
ncbi:hypothetical protein VZT92_017413 [Zoarces viviparus]|uniref:ubiquitinyl hydrolase 1 n=1 Tax=Zoarces viviparus TaxID=48416 RepID=A0AAW1ESN9_ZOAVI